MSVDEYEFLRGTAGEDGDLSKVTDLEVIFSDTSKFDKFEELTNIHRLTLIDTRMTRISNMKSIGNTLQSLTLTKQNIEKMENLTCLPNLTELFLHRNKIKRMEGLGACTKLRRLWLCENRIEKIEGLENLGDLRELCIQGNQISKLTGLESTMYLQILDVSRNNITKLQELEDLAHLANLRELSFQNVTFGACPIVFQENYRQFAICVLKQIRSLDGDLVKDQDRSDAEDDFLQKALEFNDKVEELHRLHRDELRGIELARLKGIREAEELKVQLTTQFSKLQEVIQAGREKIRREQIRQSKLREQNLDHLKSQLALLRKQHREILDGLLDEEKRMMEQEERAFAHLSRRARLELSESLALAQMSQGVVGADDDGTISKRVATQVLLNESIANGSVSSELKTLALRIREAQQHNTDKLILHRANKVFNSFLYEQHIAAISNQQQETPTSTSTVVHVYFAVPDLDSVKRILIHGFEELPLQSDGNGIVLCTDPRAAVHLLEQVAPNGGDMKGLHRVIQCRLVLENVFNIQGASDSIANYASAAQFVDTLPQESSAAKVQFTNPTTNHADTFYVLRPNDAALILPCVYMILSESNNNADALFTQEPGLEQLVATIMGKVFDSNNNNSNSNNVFSPNIEQKLQKLESKIEQYVTQYEQRIQEELEPAMAEEIESLETTVRSMEESLGSIRDQIDNEKAKQEQILRDFHQQTQPNLVM